MSWHYWELHSKADELELELLSHTGKSVCAGLVDLPQSERIVIRPWQNGSSLVQCEDCTLYRLLRQQYIHVVEISEPSGFLLHDYALPELLEQYRHCLVEKLAQQLDEFYQNSGTLEKTDTEKRISTAARIGGSDLRTRVLRLWGNRCAVTGLSLSFLLEISHIKAWADPEITAQERLDSENALPLSMNLHGLFDQGYISFDDAGKMLFREDFYPEDRTSLQLSWHTSLQRLPSDRQKKYLVHHRKKYGFDFHE